MSDGEIGHSASGSGEDSPYVFKSIASYIFGDCVLVDNGEVTGQNRFDGAKIVMVTDGNFLIGFDDPSIAMRVGRELIRVGMAMGGAEDESGDCDAPTDIDEESPEDDEPGIEQPRSGD